MQHFCGETHFQHRLPIDPSSLMRWRKRLGESGVEELLEQTVVAAKEERVIEDKGRVHQGAPLYFDNPMMPAYADGARPLLSLQIEA